MGTMQIHWFGKRFRVALMASVLTLSQGLAQDDAASEDEEAPELFQVEVVVFRHADQTRNTPEISRLVEPEIDELLDQQLARLNAPEPSELLLAEADPTESFWRPANADELIMTNDAERLQKLDAYELISHLAWIQPAADVAVAEAIATTELDPKPELSGTVKLYRKRYLHLAVDLTLGAAGSSATGGGFSQFLPVDQVRPAIVDSRRMRLGRAVYFDQPEFGVLATVSRLQPADN